MAGIMGLNTETNESNWRDLAVSELVVAVAHSFRVCLYAFSFSITSYILAALVIFTLVLRLTLISHLLCSYLTDQSYFWSSTRASVLLLRSAVYDSVTTRVKTYQVLSGTSIAKWIPVVLARSKLELS